MNAEIDDRDLARILAVGRVAAGIVLFLSPRRAARVWTGESIDSPTAVLAVRGLGARDVALGSGLLRALENGDDAAPWLLAGAIADASDALGIVSSGGMGRIRRLIWLSSSASAAYLGWSLANRD